MTNTAGDLIQFGRRPSGFLSGDAAAADPHDRGDGRFPGTPAGLRAVVRDGSRPTAWPSGGGPAPQPAPSLRDGLYHGGTREHMVHLRVDAGVSRILSGDVFATVADGALMWLASFRTPPGTAFSPADGCWTVIATDRSDEASEGRIRLRPVGDTAIQGELEFETPLEGLPWRRPILLGLEWQTGAMRRLGLEIEQEESIDPPPEVLFGGSPMTVQQALANAGFETWAAGAASRLPPPPSPRPGDEQQGWSEKDLEGLMRDYAEAALDRPTMELHLLWLSRSNRPGLFGIMFDSEDTLQRQGLAVFAEEIRRYIGEADAPRKLIQTTVHEIGHALNLAHRFERAVGRADSTSFMNYDWRYAGGGRAGEFWQRFAFTFDEDELAFLRHGPLAAVIPGGHAFHSARYWAEGNGGYSPYLSERPLPGLQLDLLPPEAGPPVFAFGQPVLLGLRLTNTGARPIQVPSYLLDVKAGFVEVTIRRLDLANRDRRQTEVFTPFIARCFDVVADTLRVLRPGDSMVENLNLTFGAAGFPFAEPGFYEVTAYLVIQQASQGRELVAPSAPIRIRVAVPHDRQEEHDALVLFTGAVGRYFALGGTIRGRAEDMLLEVLDRRQARSRSGRKAADAAVTDPVAVNIVRARAFRIGRNYHGRVGGEVRLVQEADPEASLELLNQLSDEALAATLDPVSAGQTRAYREKLKKDA